MELVGEDAPIKKDWLGDLGILYVADMGDSFQVLLERDLPSDVTKEELHQLAVENLNRDIEFKLHDKIAALEKLVPSWPNKETVG